MSNYLKINLKRICFLILGFGMLSTVGIAQHVGATPEQIRLLTSEWTGERFPDGRPKVSDQILERLKSISIEEAWGVLRNKGYNNQYEGDWQIIWPDSVMTGRVVTAQYMPLRPDFDKFIKTTGV
jgi:4-hydroxy-4-methyl-2-oxoglutarate aldolase